VNVRVVFVKSGGEGRATSIVVHGEEALPTFVYRVLETRDGAVELYYDGVRWVRRSLKTSVEEAVYAKASQLSSEGLGVIVLTNDERVARVFQG